MKTKKLKKQLQKLCKRKVYRTLETAYRYHKGFVLNVIEDCVLMLEVEDFHVQGFALYKIERFTNIRNVDYDKYMAYMIEQEKLIQKYDLFAYDNFKSVRELYQYLQVNNETVVAQNESIKHYDFLIGTIRKIGKKKLQINHFNACGVLTKPYKIRFDRIEILKFKDHYAENFKKYVQ